jgi:hypothetical protein
MVEAEEVPEANGVELIVIAVELVSAVIVATPPESQFVVDPGFVNVNGPYPLPFAGWLIIIEVAFTTATVVPPAIQPCVPDIVAPTKTGPYGGLLVKVNPPALMVVEPALTETEPPLGGPAIPVKYELPVTTVGGRVMVAPTVIPAGRLPELGLIEVLEVDKVHVPGVIVGGVAWLGTNSDPT